MTNQPHTAEQLRALIKWPRYIDSADCVECGSFHEHEVAADPGGRHNFNCPIVEVNATLEAGAVAIEALARLYACMPTCAECGPCWIDEDGCCTTCGAEAASPGDPMTEEKTPPTLREQVEQIMRPVLCRLENYVDEGIIDSDAALKMIMKAQGDLEATREWLGTANDSIGYLMAERTALQFRVQELEMDRAVPGRQVCDVC